MPHTTTVPALVLRRTYAVPPQRVYEAWTTPSIAKQFLGPNDTLAESVELDVRAGGSYRIVMRLADGERFIAVGTYHEVVPGSRLVMSWRWLEDDPADEIETLLTLEFNATAEGTELILTHERLRDEASRDRHTTGWTAIIEQLAKTLEDR